MFTRGVKIVLITGTAMTVLALALHFLLVYDRAPTYAQWDLLNTFVATFATVVFTFFSGRSSTTTRRRSPNAGVAGSSSTCSWPS